MWDCIPMKEVHDCIYIACLVLLLVFCWDFDSFTTVNTICPYIVLIIHEVNL